MKKFEKLRQLFKLKLKEDDSTIKQIRDIFLTGLFVLVPIAITFWVIFTVLAFVNNLILPYIRYVIPIPNIPGLGIIITLLLVFLVGLFAQNYFGKKALEFWDMVVQRIPLVRSIYYATKQTMETLFTKRQQFSKTVLVEFPRKDVYSIGFIANEVKICEEEYFVVYVPTAPNPTSGYTLFVKKEEVINTDLTVEEATRIILSGGLVIKKKIKFVQKDEGEIRALNGKDEEYLQEVKQRSSDQPHREQG